jgi:amidohydrolase
MNDRQILHTAVSLRRRIHRYPELGGEEFKTTALVVKTLKSAGIPFKRFRPTGAAGLVGKESGSPCVALRADLDALPLTERAKWPHRSRHPNVMHACGHDAHTAMVLTSALSLAREKSLPGAVKFLFQPDEEGSGGARRLIQQGALRSPRVDAVFGIHVNPRLPAGTIGVKAGPLMAAVDRFTIEIYGQGGHGAYPHEGRDAVVAAAQVVQALQCIVSRRVDPVEPVVVTVGTIRGGDRFNILAEKAVLAGTVRTLTEGLRSRMPGLINETVDGAVRTHGSRHRLKYERLGRPVINDPDLAEWALAAARRSAGARRALRLDAASMGGEDFSEYAARVPGCFVYLGTGANPTTRRPWHHPEFFMHEPSMLVGVRFLTELAREALNRLRNMNQKYEM